LSSEKKRQNTKNVDHTDHLLEKLLYRKWSGANQPPPKKNRAGVREDERGKTGREAEGWGKRQGERAGGGERRKGVADLLLKRQDLFHGTMSENIGNHTQHV
jgi:hypothetical protein